MPWWIVFVGLYGVFSSQAIDLVRMASQSTVIATAQVGASCPEGWRKSPSDKCYKFSTFATNWETAFMECQGMKSILASPKTPSEMKWIRDYRENHDHLQDRMWIGGFRISDEWYWNDVNFTLIEVTDWAPEEPTGGREECLQLFEGSTLRDNQNFANRWSDEYCSERMRFICEKDSDGAIEETATTNADMVSTTTSIRITSTPPVTLINGCPADWVRSRSRRCYKFVDGWNQGPGWDTWQSANQQCQAMGSFLAAPKTYSEMKWIRDYREARYALQDRMWIGGYFRNNHWWWRGAKDTRIDRSDWARDEPSDSSWEVCLQLFEGSSRRAYYESPNRWNNALCSEKMGYICEKNSGHTAQEPVTTPSVTAIPTAAPPKCPEDWIQSQRRRCYKFITTPLVIWKIAERQCRDMGSFLASPKTYSEIMWIRDYREAHVNFQGQMWIGGFFKDEKWWWKDANSTLIRASDWARGEPSYIGNGRWEECVQLMEGSSIKSDYNKINRWNDVHCDQKIGFICEKDTE